MEALDLSSTLAVFFVSERFFFALEASLDFGTSSFETSSFDFETSSLISNVLSLVLYLGFWN